MAVRHINSNAHSWPVAGSFRISHGSLTQINVVTVHISQNGLTGRGECRPYARYNETPKSVLQQIESIRVPLENGLTTQALQYALPAGAARNAVDCALWDLKAKQSGNPVHKMLGLPVPVPRPTAFTLSIDSPEAMARAAIAAKAYSLLKLKINGPEGLEAAFAVLNARPDAELILDANEALTGADIEIFQNTLNRYPVIMIEQPIKAKDALSTSIDPKALPVLCADESLHTTKDLDPLWAAGYRAVNVKLDKCGGLTEGLALMRAAKARGFIIMAGCMVGSSLAMAPMTLLAHYADVIDLDGPALLAQDCEYPLSYENGFVGAPDERLWGV